MDLVEAIYKRKSIRGYKPDPVPMETVKKVLEIGVRAPSAMNTQPWELTVVTGDVLENIKKGNLEALANAEGSGLGVKYEGVYKERQVELAKQVFELMGIERHDKEQRKEWMKNGFRFFDAPVGIIVSIDRSMEKSWAIFDIGCLCQTICLAALEYDLGTCIAVQGVIFEDVIRKHTGLSSSKKIIMGISLGYPDWDFPANKVESEREEVNNIKNWLGWE